ncbi:MAG: hypothetical protein OXD32_01810 [Endozoicomonadaceae bacterium]|nr:hypothetical protein [Endozoicomonadaceae bacterium]
MKQKTQKVNLYEDFSTHLLITKRQINYMLQCDSTTSHMKTASSLLCVLRKLPQPPFLEGKVFELSFKIL